MPLQPLFGIFEGMIRSRFARAQIDFGSSVAGVRLEIHEEPRRLGRPRAEFLTVVPAGPVRITWNAIASLWALSQGASRIGRCMFDARQAGKKLLDIGSDAEIERGMYSLELSRRFLFGVVPDIASSMELWPEWAPQIILAPQVATDDHVGNRFFGGALDWVLRHELAHVSLNHLVRERNEGLSRKACEQEADTEATRLLLAALRATPLVDEKSHNEKLIADSTAFSIGIGLIWVSLFEAEFQISDDYPRASTRLFDCLAQLGLSADSGAALVLSDVVKAWIDPEGNWDPLEGIHTTTTSALDDALVRLHRRLVA